MKRDEMRSFSVLPGMGQEDKTQTPVIGAAGRRTRKGLGKLALLIGRYTTVSIKHEDKGFSLSRLSRPNAQDHEQVLGCLE